MEDAQSDYVAVTEGGFGGPKVINTLSNSEKLWSTFGTRKGGIEAARFIMAHGKQKNMVGMI